MQCLGAEQLHFVPYLITVRREYHFRSETGSRRPERIHFVLRFYVVRTFVYLSHASKGANDEAVRVLIQ